MHKRTGTIKFVKPGRSGDGDEVILIEPVTHMRKSWIPSELLSFVLQSAGKEFETEGSDHVDPGQVFRLSIDGKVIYTHEDYDKELAIDMAKRAEVDNGLKLVTQEP